MYKHMFNLLKRLKMNIFKGFAWTLVKLAYRIKVRGLLVEKIGDPDADWDEKVIELLDVLFEYTP